MFFSSHFQFQRNLNSHKTKEAMVPRTSVYQHCGGNDEESLLRQELDELRESSRCALLKSWADVEQLHEENIEYQERNCHLELELTASKRREESYRKQLDEIKSQQEVELAFGRHEKQQHFLTFCCAEKVQNNNTKLGKLLAAGNSLIGAGDFQVDGQSSQGTMMMDCSSNRSQEDFSASISLDPLNSSSIEWSDHSNKKRSSQQEKCRWGGAGNWMQANVLHDKEREKMEQELTMHISELEKEKNFLIAQWQYKLESQDIALQNMERIAKGQEGSLAKLRKKHETKSKQFREKQAKLKKEIGSLREKLNDKRSKMAKQSDELKECKTYIRELTRELEKVWFPASS